MSTIRTLLAGTGAALLLAGTSLHAGAAAPKPVIEDPIGDANFVNDQGTGDGSFGDQTAADAGSVSDLISVTMTNDAKKLYVQLQTEAAPPAATGIGFRVRANPAGPGGSYCIKIEVFYPGANNVLTSAQGHVTDTCAGTDPVPITVLGQMLEVPRSATKAFGRNAKLTKLQAQSFLWTGTYPQGVAGPYADTTKIGKDFVFADRRR